MQTCPCGSEKAFKECCQPLLNNLVEAATPEALMRSRYTAYHLKNIDYIARTMKGAATMHFNKQEVKNWAKHILWLHLEIINTEFENDYKGYVEFKATYVEGKKKYVLHEKSEFIYQNQRWYYVDGIQYQT